MVKVDIKRIILNIIEKSADIHIRFNRKVNFSGDIRRSQSHFSLHSCASYSNSSASVDVPDL